MLTVAAIKKLKPGEVPDGHGLRLVVYPTGRMAWIMRFRQPDGKQAKLTLGPCELEAKGEPAMGVPLSLPMARVLAISINMRRHQGSDVAMEHRLRRSRHIDPKASFANAARDYVELEARDRKKNRGWKGTARMLGLLYDEDDEPTTVKGGLCDRWRNKPVSSIT